MKKSSFTLRIFILYHFLANKYIVTNKYFLSILIDFIPQIKKETKSIIGLDLGIKDFIVDSNGNRYSNPKFYVKQQKKLKHLNRIFSKKQMIKTGNQVYSKKWNKMIDETRLSNNKEKARLEIAKLNEKITNQRKNYIQQLTTQIVNENQIICIEDLNVKGMIKNHKLAKSIQDVSWGEFINVLEYKCKLYNRTLIRIDRFYPSSKRCNHCGYINKGLKLKDREWVCPECGCIIDRDYNAALNILDEGIKNLENSNINCIFVNEIGLSSPEYKLVENPTVDDKDINPLKSSGFVKQEKNVFQ